MTEPYCERCGDTGMVSREQIGIQPQAVRCSCVRYNPVIQARYKAMDTPARGGSFLANSSSTGSRPQILSNFYGVLGGG